MQAYAEGFEIMRHSEFDLDLQRDRGHLAARVRRALAGCSTCSHAAFETDGSKLEEIARLRRGLRRGTLDGHRGDQRERAGAGDHGSRSSPASRRGRTSRSRRRWSPRCATSSAATRSRRSNGQGRTGPAMTTATAQENPLLEGLQLRRTPEPCIARHLRRLRRPDRSASSSRRSTRSRTAACSRRTSRSSASRAPRRPTTSSASG